jgi:predicted site-specific integrase-resolvase
MSNVIGGYKDAAAYLNISQAILRKIVKAGTIKPIDDGTGVLWFYEDELDVLAAQRALNVLIEKRNHRREFERITEDGLQ